VQQLVLALQTEQASLPERKLAPLREAVSQGLQVRTTCCRRRCCNCRRCCCC
jgi:hypothetical protein